MKICLINLFSPFDGSKYTSGLICLEPLGLEYIAAVAIRARHETNVLSPYANESLESFANRIIKYNPNVIGIGPETYNFNKAKKLSKLIKDKLKSVTIIFGGYHVTAVPSEVSDPHIDIVVIGEGEYTFVKLVNCLAQNTSYENIDGIAFCKDNRIIINPLRQRIKNLDELPYPYRDKNIMSMCLCKGIYYPQPSKQQSPAQVVYSRGCLYNCIYCSSKNMWGNAVIYREPDKVTQEIVYLIETYKTNLVFFSDLTFNLNKKKVNELCNSIIKKNIRISWFCGCRPDCMDEELLYMMKEAGCSRIHYGIESVDKFSLEKIKRRRSYSTIENTLELTSKAGIITRGYLIIGFPWETKESLESINDKLNELYIDELRISFCTPFHETEIFTKTDGEFSTKNLNDFSTDKPIYKLPGLDNMTMLKLRENIFNEYYSSNLYLNRVKNKLLIYPHLFNSFQVFFKEINLHFKLY